MFILFSILLLFNKFKSWSKIFLIKPEFFLSPCFISFSFILFFLLISEDFLGLGILVFFWKSFSSLSNLNSCILKLSLSLIFSFVLLLLLSVILFKSFATFFFDFDIIWLIFPRIFWIFSSSFFKLKLPCFFVYVFLGVLFFILFIIFCSSLFSKLSNFFLIFCVLLFISWILNGFWISSIFCFCLFSRVDLGMDFLFLLFDFGFGFGLLFEDLFFGSIVLKFIEISSSFFVEFLFNSIVLYFSFNNNILFSWFISVFLSVLFLFSFFLLFFEDVLFKKVLLKNSSFNLSIFLIILFPMSVILFLLLFSIVILSILFLLIFPFFLFPIVLLLIILVFSFLFNTTLLWLVTSISLFISWYTSFEVLNLGFVSGFRKGLLLLLFLFIFLLVFCVFFGSITLTDIICLLFGDCWEEITVFDVFIWLELFFGGFLSDLIGTFFSFEGLFSIVFRSNSSSYELFSIISSSLDSILFFLNNF